ncbi:uncharacterized protein [Venturia canescens]|uniref:uncharacterized protein n=1 Tax=Venturia canescens TaxID=32260 RepID=UPI001C9C966B|nr:uncharacterized protein LOC122418346 [Venturia canescens]
MTIDKGFEYTWMARHIHRILDIEIKMVAASNIGEEEFLLYSGRATWAEAVVQCREKGLQVAEVRSVKEAQTLAASMLRNRPAVESAWIGGYTKKTEPGTWRWLVSGEEIRYNGMRLRNLSQSIGGCLLLDRHSSEIPVYVEAKCDRKRDVLCQKPSFKKRASTKPVRVFVSGCSYWIGFQPSTWSKARKSCELMNASLVALDSPEKISHMISLMVDNKAGFGVSWTPCNFPSWHLPRFILHCKTLLLWQLDTVANAQPCIYPVGLLTTAAVRHFPDARVFPLFTPSGSAVLTMLDMPSL